MGEQVHSILIVEDDGSVAERLRHALGSLGYDTCAIAASVEEAVAEASRRRPDLALVAVGLKGPLDGIDAAGILRGRYAIPIVYLTADTDDATIQRAQHTEPYGYLRKPVQPAELQSAIEMAIYKRETETRRQRGQPSVATANAGAATVEIGPLPGGAGPVARGRRRTTVLLADDHAMLREGLEKLLTEHDFDVVGTVADGDQLLAAARRLRPDVIVTDISMPPGLSGLDVLARLKAERIDSRVIVLTMHNDAEFATRATRAGALGFLLKHSAGDELVTAIHHALQGSVYLTPAVTKGVMERLSAPAAPDSILTPRQVDVLRLIVEGRRMKEIAAVLDLSTRTVETHKYQMMQALGVESTAELVKYAIEHRLIEK